MTLDLKDGDNEDLIKKNKKRKPLGGVQVKITLTPMTKEEMNEVSKCVFKKRFAGIFLALLYLSNVFVVL